jgi:2-polyprenyl-3-methyl-5-hydroxy-6-metoxy-1,4-benzoquinol methylase
MKLSRSASLRVNRFLDQYAPPVLRDSTIFRRLARRMYGKLTIDIVDLKARAFYLSRLDLENFYVQLQSRFDQGVTDLTPASLDAVLRSVRGDRVLDVACGRGYLCNLMAERGLEVVGCDVAVSSSPRDASGPVQWVNGNVEELPFRDNIFDTVVSTHTLEHVQQLARAIDELRRVAHNRIVLVVPRQRPYLATFNQHIHFFPYEFSLLAWTGTGRPHTLELVGGDWLYIEDCAVG